MFFNYYPYSFQFNDPNFHSQNRVIIINKKNIENVELNKIIFEILKFIIIGKIIEISISKIKKIIVIKQKFNEKGIRDLLNGSNPHSKGADLFKLNFIFILINIIIIIKIVKIVSIIINKIKLIIIILFKIKLFDWKSNILDILIKLIVSSIESYIEKQSDNINKMSISSC